MGPDRQPVSTGAMSERFSGLLWHVPHDMTERVKAKPLAAGVTYRVEGWDGDSYSGAFRFRKGVVVENVKAAPGP